MFWVDYRFLQFLRHGKPCHLGLLPPDSTPKRYNTLYLAGKVCEKEYEQKCPYSFCFAAEINLLYGRYPLASFLYLTTLIVLKIIRSSAEVAFSAAWALQQCFAFARGAHDTCLRIEAESTIGADKGLGIKFFCPFFAFAACVNTPKNFRRQNHDCHKGDQNIFCHTFTAFLPFDGYIKYIIAYLCGNVK